MVLTPEEVDRKIKQEHYKVKCRWIDTIDKQLVDNNKHAIITYKYGSVPESIIEQIVELYYDAGWKVTLSQDWWGYRTLEIAKKE